MTLDLCVKLLNGGSFNGFNLEDGWSQQGEGNSGAMLQGQAKRHQTVFTTYESAGLEQTACENGTCNMTLRIDTAD